MTIGTLDDAKLNQDVLRCICWGNNAHHNIVTQTRHIFFGDFLRFVCPCLAILILLQIRQFIVHGADECERNIEDVLTIFDRHKAVEFDLLFQCP